jgi:hypothetical protein
MCYDCKKNVNILSYLSGCIPVIKSQNQKMYFFRVILSQKCIYIILSLESRSIIKQDQTEETNLRALQQEPYIS